MTGTTGHLPGVKITSEKQAAITHPRVVGRPVIVLGYGVVNVVKPDPVNRISPEGVANDRVICRLGIVFRTHRNTPPFFACGVCVRAAMRSCQIFGNYRSFRVLRKTSNAEPSNRPPAGSGMTVAETVPSIL